MVTEKEFLVVVYDINKFQHYITSYSTFVHTDHSFIKYLMNTPINNARVTRWLLLFQEFDITIGYKPGKDNMVAYFLSRLTNNSDDCPVEECFPNEHLFVIYNHSPWYEDISIYLTVGKLLQNLSPRERRKIVQQSAQYCWICGYLFQIGLDQEILNCVREEEVCDILKAFDSDPCGRHFTDKRICYKEHQMGYYWPSLFQDGKKYV